MKVWIVTSGDLLKASGVRSFDSIVLETMSRTERKFMMAMYVLRFEPEEFWENLEKMAGDGVEIKIILDGGVRQDPKVTEQLKHMENRYKNFEWKLFHSREIGSLHAKLIVSDTYRTVIGSANITHPGLFANHEIGVLIEDERLAWVAGNLFMKLWYTST